MIELNSELIQKMRLKEGNSLIVLDNEKEYKFSPIDGVRFTNQSSEADGILLFANSSSSLKSAFLKILKSIGRETLLWIAYPKKSSGIKTDLDRDHGWDILSENGYDGVSLISLNDTWSAARFKKADTVKKGGSKAEKQKRPELSKYINYEKKTVQLPDDVKKSFSKNKKAKESFEVLAWSHKREYIESILEAKSPETRSKRILKMVETLSSPKTPAKKKSVK